jgi:hypothetical protein
MLTSFSLLVTWILLDISHLSSITRSYYRTTLDPHHSDDSVIAFTYKDPLSIRTPVGPSHVGTKCSSVGIVLFLYRLYETYQLCLSAMKHVDGCSPSRKSLDFLNEERTKVSERIPVNIIQPLHFSAPGYLESVVEERRSTTRRGIRYHQSGHEKNRNILPISSTGTTSTSDNMALISAIQ